LNPYNKKQCCFVGFIGAQSGILFGKLGEIPTLTCFFMPAY